MIPKDVFRQYMTMVLIAVAVGALFVSTIPAATYGAFIGFAATIVSVNMATKPGVNDDGK